jgi:gamma-glutamylcyclotransferase
MITGKGGAIMLYFAYGSNVDWNQMRKRCPSVQFVCVALLRDHRLIFPRRSLRRNCGVAGAVRAKDAEVWGVVYQILDTEVAMLDKHEDFEPGRERGKNAYVREERHVCRDGDKEQPLLVHMYFANPEPDPPLPNAEYKELIVRGAEYWHLPPTYIDELRTIEVGD